MKIKADKSDLMKVDSAIIIGLANEKDVKLNIQGKLSLDEVLDMINTALLELLTTYEKSVIAQHGLKGEAQHKAKTDIYERAVMGFSLMIDKYNPEGVKTRFNGLTEKAIMEKQDEILSRRQK